MPKSDALLGHHGQSPNDAAARHTMEPECREIFGVHSDITPLMSIAISLKRIADMLEQSATEEPQLRPSPVPHINPPGHPDAGHAIKG